MGCSVDRSLSGSRLQGPAPGQPELSSSSVLLKPSAVCTLSFMRQQLRGTAQQLSLTIALQTARARSPWIVGGLAAAWFEGVHVEYSGFSQVTALHVLIKRTNRLLHLTRLPKQRHQTWTHQPRLWGGWDRPKCSSGIFVPRETGVIVKIRGESTVSEHEVSDVTTSAVTKACKARTSSACGLLCRTHPN